MADRTPPRRRTPVSRAPVSRPRKVAGLRPGAEPAAEPASEPLEPATEPLEPTDEPAPAPAPEPEEEVEEAPEPESTDEAPPRRRRATTVLAVLAVLLAAVAGGEAWYLWGRGEPTVSASRPVVVSPVAAAGAADTAARALVEIVSTSYRDYDDQVEEAVRLMTPAFAEEYRQTAEDVREAIETDQTEVTATVNQQAVVTASARQVQALVFLDQTVAKNNSGPQLTPFRALVTVVKQGDRWLVSGIDTQ